MSGFALAAAAVSSLIALPILSRNVPTDRFGQLTFILMLVNLAAALDGIRLPLVKLLHSRGRRRPVIRAGQSVGAILASIGFGASLLATQAFGLGDYGWPESLLIAAAVACWLLSSPYAGVLIAEHRVGLVQVVRSLGIATIYLFFAAWSYRSDDVTHYAFATLVIFVAMLLGFRQLAAGLGPVEEASGPGETAESLRWLYPRVGPLLLFQAIAAFASTLDGFFVTTFLGVSAFGLYAAHHGITVRLNLIAAVVSRAVFPHLSAELDPSQLSRYSLILRGTVLFQVLVSFPAFFWSRELSGLLFGPEYAPHHGIIRVVVIAVTVQTVGYFGPALLNALGDFSTQTWCFAAGLVVMAVAGPFLVLHHGLIGAALMFLCGRFADVLICGVTLRRLQHLSPAVEGPLRARLGIFLVAIFALFGAVTWMTPAWLPTLVLEIALGAGGLWLLFSPGERSDALRQLAGLRG
ncbi:hypothetical protein ABI59_06175 [Acidobacteria bacterium Mor1]|nr:hypothetical protein ABI59_06175 [Acidobacteria bacterium Mor1]